MKNIIFDWSGVVRDTVVSQLWIVNSIFKTYGVLPITLEEFRENWKQPYQDFYGKYLPKGYSETDQARLYKEALFHADCPKSRSFGEVVEVIKKCRGKGYFLAVVSSDLGESLYPEVSEWGLEGVFNEIHTDVDNKLEAVKKIIEANKLRSDETFFVGDSNHEIDVSRETGIKSVAVTWGFTSERKLRAGNPDYVAHDPQELERIIM